MSEKSKSVVDSIKDRIKKAGSAKTNSWFIKDGQKRRIRFVSDMEEAVLIKFHSKWQKYYEPCKKHFGGKCKHCNATGDTKVDMYVWTIYDYENKQRYTFMFKAANTTPVPTMVDMFEAYGTITDRDFTISRKGESTNTAYGLVPLDKARFKKKGIKPFTKKEILKLLEDQFFGEDKDYDEDDEDIDDDEELDDDDIDDDDIDDDLDDDEEEDDDDEEEDEEEDEEDEEEDEEPVKKSKKSSKKKKESPKSKPKSKKKK